MRGEEAPNPFCEGYQGEYGADPHLRPRTQPVRYLLWTLQGRTGDGDLKAVHRGGSKKHLCGYFRGD